MEKQIVEGDRLFLIAESLAQDFSLFPASESEELLPGLLPEREIIRQTKILATLDVDSYIEEVVSPAEDHGRMAAPEAVRQMGKVLEETSIESFYSAVVQMVFPDGDLREVGFIAQNRGSRNGVWMPTHHVAAANCVKEFAKRSMPIVTLMDTPGADAEEQANRDNQAHSISRLIAEMSDVDVPNIGIIFGLGYSGGAIPLAASNMILSVRDGVFSTIQPKSLANIARRLNLSWQECAKYVGLSPCELFSQGNIDGVIDYAPGDPLDKIDNLRSAIINGIENIESRVSDFVSDNPYILDHYRESLQRYLDPSRALQNIQEMGRLGVSKNPTEYMNVFGVAFRYLRYLKVRQRIRATNISQYGRLADGELPEGELAIRAERDRRHTFIKWLQDPDKVVYDDSLAKAWKSYNDKKQAMHDERGRIAKLLFGEPRKNFEDARANLISTVGVFLYNRWKGEALGNLRALQEVLEQPKDVKQIFRGSDLSHPVALIDAIKKDPEILSMVRESFTHEGRKLLNDGNAQETSSAFLANELASQLNLCLGGDSLDPNSKIGTGSSVEANRNFLCSRFPGLLSPASDAESLVVFSDMTVLDILIMDELRQDFLAESESLVLFDSVYDRIIANLDSIASEAQADRALSKSSLSELIDSAVDSVAKTESEYSSEADSVRLREQFLDWHLRLRKMAKGSNFFKKVEEWKKASFAHLSDTLFVVVTHLFDVLLFSFIQSEREGKTFVGRISPRNIGRKKDFWNRLNIAYKDLLIQNVLRDFKSEKKIDYQLFIDEFIGGFEERDPDLLSTDPCAFPGFRLALEQALNRGIPPAGVVTGVGDFKSDQKTFRVGVLVSNVGFQAGSFDMASAEKFCRLLVECAEQHIPVICFVSSGGMQTKEGAGALFSMAAVNDRITRFVRDHDLPVIVFGFGDCTGGAQASFVTHPLVHTFYLSGTSMPFAGQIVVPSNLPLDSILSNYLSQVPGAMQGLVKHPFHKNLDRELTLIDPAIPVPQESVVDVVDRIIFGVLDRHKPVVVAHQPKYTNADLVKPVRRVLVHARGCTAAKLIKIGQQEGIEVVLVQSDPDMESAPAEMLEEQSTLVCIGGNTPDESYLNAMSVVSVAEHEGVDALHPGIGFLSENAQFAELCRSHGINFIGPPVSSMETMGNKSNAINTALKLKVPVVPGSHGILTDIDRASEVAEDIGYPILIKAVHGGGGKGIQVVEKPEQFHELFHRVTVEARAAFGNGDVYLEKFVTSLRHIEAQLLRDHHGNTKVLGIRDCSVQRDKQKVIEESSSTLLPENLREQILKHTAALADEVGYVGAGTVEFIYDLAANDIYFMEMNTRLQVEHPVTEWVSGINIVKEQFRIASGESIEELSPLGDGYAMEARINAERIRKNPDGSLEFRPQPGQIEDCYFPDEQDVEIIAAAGPGKFISPFYDSMIAQVIVYAADREAAARKLFKYLNKVRINGISTNIPLLRSILVDEVFLGGDYDTEYLPQLLDRLDIDSLIDEIDATAGISSSGFSKDAIEIEESDELKVLSPSTAIFYDTPTPTEPPYVSVGDRVRIGDTIGQLEAMKLFTPLSLDDFNTDNVLYDPQLEYEVTRINMGSGQQVNIGDLLFVVKPCH